MTIESIHYKGPKFIYFKKIHNAYDFEIALETISNNIHNTIKRGEE
jgi:hypothetical protein